jgi:hypothetical protein
MKVPVWLGKRAIRDGDVPIMTWGEARARWWGPSYPCWRRGFGEALG